MTKRTFYGFLIACSVILNIVFFGMWMTHAAPRHFIKHRQCGAEQAFHQGCPMQKALSLSDSQWALMKPGIESLRETTTSVLCREMAKNRAALVDELEKTPTDSAALSACMERIVASQRKMQMSVVNHLLEEKKILTQDQQRRFFKAIRNNMSCAGGPGMMGMTPEGIDGRCPKNHIERPEGGME
jgi:Spy/CpxP family protein refolding chaperone